MCVTIETKQTRHFSFVVCLITAKLRSFKVINQMTTITIKKKTEIVINPFKGKNDKHKI